MAGWPEVRHALGRIFFAPATLSAGARDTHAPVVVRAVRRILAGIDTCLSAARRRNEQVAIEETKSYLRAKRRSLGLMLALLSPEQHAEFHRYRYFHVIGAETGNRYRIRVASFANIDVIGPSGSTLYRLCAHPRGDVPVYDVMAAQMLHLQDAQTERAFLRFANVHPVVAHGRRTEPWL